MADAPLPEDLVLKLEHCGSPMRLHHGHPTGWEAGFEITGAVYLCCACPATVVIRSIEPSSRHRG